MRRISGHDKFFGNSWFSDLAASSSGEALALHGMKFQRFSQDQSTQARYEFTTAYPADGVGEKLPVPLPTPVQLLLAAAVADDIPGDTSTTKTLTVGGPRIVSTINTPGDFDFFKIELQAGITYDFGMYAKTNGPSTVPLADAFIEIYDAAGNKLAAADGGATTQLNQVNTGLDVLYAFTAETTGTYYVNARAFDEEPSDGDDGEFVGDYEVFARVSNYKPYYDLDSPLHSLDWGTQFDGTSRNPDNAEGPRVTGNEVENKIGGKNVLYVYFARENEVFVDSAGNPGNLTTTIVAKGLEPWERQSFENVFAEYEKVADLDYVETEDRYAADIVVITYDGTPGPGVSLLGRMSPPDTPNEGQTEYNSGDERWTQEGLAPGGFYFGTLIHEFGHGHGMAHPHDNGGKSSIMRDADTETGYVEETTPFNYTLGDYDLNQGIYTMMSYMDGWQLSPYGQPSSTAGYGYLGSLMAFDIAVMQDKYGVNEEWATGNDTYTLTDENVAAEFDANGNQTQEATSYKSIWDAGGIDAIVYVGARNANIDLRPATLQYEYGGGGWVSYAFGIYGGFTIANAVTIENATSDSGNDTLIGNAAGNRLDAGAGNDLLVAILGGVDEAIGGSGDDAFHFGGSLTPADIVTGGAGTDTLVLQGDYASGLVLTTNVTGLEGLTFLAGSNTVNGESGSNRYDYVITSHDANFGAGPDGYARIDGSSLLAGEDLTFNGSAESDSAFRMLGGKGVDILTGGSLGDLFVFAHEGRFGAGDQVIGGGGYDALILRGDYVIDFNAAGFAGALQAMESLHLISFSDTNYGSGGDGEFDYSIIWNNALAGAGQTFTVNGAKLQAAETMSFDGSTEADGHFRLFGGAAADTLIGGGGNDMLYGNVGSDILFGNGGADTFRYQNVADSVAGAFDTIQGFTHLTDKIDLSVIDANSFAGGNQAFTFIGANAFSGLGLLSAGQLRASQVAGDLWQVQGDVNGDGTADLHIQVVMQPGQPLDGNDFLF